MLDVYESAGQTDKDIERQRECVIHIQTLLFQSDKCILCQLRIIPDI